MAAGLYACAIEALGVQRMAVRLVPVLAALLGALVLMSGPIKAEGKCDADLKVVDEALSKTQLADDERDQIEDMRSQAQALCDSGNTDEGLELLSEAKGILGIE
jgi:hypothetical protein